MTGQPFSFTPESIPGATKPRFMGQTCHGRDLRDIPLDTLLARGIDFRYVIDSYRNLGLGDSYFSFDSLGDHFELLTGTRRVREAIENADEEYKTEYKALYDSIADYVPLFKFSKPIGLEEVIESGTGLSFETTDVYGNPVKSSDLFSGHKVTMFNIWETTCGACISEFPNLLGQALSYALVAASIVKSDIFNERRNI